MKDKERKNRNPFSHRSFGRVVGQDQCLLFEARQNLALVASRVLWLWIQLWYCFVAMLKS